jgi:preprotein translocase subunit SecD
MMPAGGQIVRRTGAVLIIAAMIFGVGQSGAQAEEIAVSLVNPKGRIDIPVSAVVKVEASATIAFRNSETGKVWEHSDPHVDICVAEEFKARICELTTQSVGEVLAIVIDCETVTKPIVREPLCARSCFTVSANDLEEANALAQRMRRGSNRACAPSF